MSPSIVTALNVSTTEPDTHRLQQRGGADRRIGEHERQHRRHVGRDHAGALGDAADRHGRLAELGIGGRDLGKRVGGHDRLGGVEKAPGAAFSAILSSTPSKLLAPAAARRSRPSRQGTLRPACSLPQRSASFAVQRRRGAAVLAREGVGVAGVDDQRARALPPLSLLAAPLDRGGRALRARGVTPATVGALVEQREQHVGAALVARCRPSR